MPWFKVDDHLHDHRKARVAGVHAMGLWVLAGSWCADHLMDGFVPAAVALRWGADMPELAERLAVAGLWEPWEQDGEAGWLFHDWKVMQPTRAQVEHERETARERMRARRSPNVQPNTDRSSGAVRVPRPDPTRPNTHSSNGYAADFAAWWLTYPQKAAKAAAAKAYTRVLKTTSPEAIETGTARWKTRWAAENTELKHIPYGATFLNQRRFEDELTDSTLADDDWMKGR